MTARGPPGRRWARARARAARTQQRASRSVPASRVAPRRTERTGLRRRYGRRAAAALRPRRDAVGRERTTVALRPVATWRPSASRNARWSTGCRRRAGMDDGSMPSSVTVAEADGPSRRASRRGRPRRGGGCGRAGVTSGSPVAARTRATRGHRAPPCLQRSRGRRRRVERSSSRARLSRARGDDRHRGGEPGAAARSIRAAASEAPLPETPTPRRARPASASCAYSASAARGAAAEPGEAAAPGRTRAKRSGRRRIGQAECSAVHFPAMELRDLPSVDELLRDDASPASRTRSRSTAARAALEPRARGDPGRRRSGRPRRALRARSSRGAARRACGACSTRPA